MKPLFDNILIKEEIKETSSVYVTYTEDEVKTAEVISVGNGKEKEPIYVKPGDKIIYNSTGTKINLDGQIYLIIKQKDILAIL